MKVQKIIAAVLAVACIQSANAAWVKVTNATTVLQHVKADSKGFANGMEQVIIKPNGSYTFKSGAHRVHEITWQAVNKNNTTSYGPRYVIRPEIPAATLTYSITIQDGGWKYNTGVGSDKSGNFTSIDNMADSVYFSNLNIQ